MNGINWSGLAKFNTSTCHTEVGVVSFCQAHESAEEVAQGQWGH